MMRTPAEPRTRALRATTLTMAGVLLLILALTGSRCSPGHRATDPRTPLVILFSVPIFVAAPAPATKPTVRPDPVAITVVGCSHGTVGISTVNAPQPHWVIASVHLRSPQAIKELRITSVELLDKSERVVARSARVEAFRIGKPQVSYPDRCGPHAKRRPNHLSKADSRPFDGTIAPRIKHRLWLHMRMAGDYGRAVRARPTRCRITFTTATGQTHKATIDQVGGWPTG